MLVFEKFCDPRVTRSPFWEPELKDWGLWPEPPSSAKGTIIKFRRYPDV